MVPLNIPAEVANRGCYIDINALPAGLKRRELTPDGKRWQLWSIGIKGASAEYIVEELYGAGT